MVQTMQGFKGGHQLFELGQKPLKLDHHQSCILCMTGSINIVTAAF